LKTVLDRESREEEHNKAANLLLINIHLIKQGMKEIELQDIYRNNENVSIKLDPAKSPRKNVDNYFEKSRSEKLNRAKSLTLYEKSKKEFEATQKKVTEIEKGISPQRLKEMMDELKIKTQNQSDDREDIRSKFKRYVIDNKYFVFVGRDSKNNDLLTTKFAKQNDYWFHARSLPGSHVVLKVDNSIDNVPKDVLKRTASLAAYHSKAKTAGMVPVSYTQKKYVVKKKGMEAGKVALLKEEVLIVKPGIPAGCEFIESD
jgi:predicted ribosome quality control (RQC) complex YloA/Tae2 family protein